MSLHNLNNEVFETDLNINDLKCCGNCVFRCSIDMGNAVEENCIKNRENITSSSEYCDDWMYDDLILAVRRV